MSSWDNKDHFRDKDGQFGSPKETKGYYMKRIRRIDRENGEYENDIYNKLEIEEDLKHFKRNKYEEL